MTFGAPAPALIGSLVDIAVITREIATAVHLQHELAERSGGGEMDGLFTSGLAGSDSRIEFCARYRSRLRARHDSANFLIDGHRAQGRHLRQRYIAEICQLRRNNRTHDLSGLHSLPANLAQGSGTTGVVLQYVQF